MATRPPGRKPFPAVWDFATYASSLAVLSPSISEVAETPRAHIILIPQPREKDLHLLVFKSRVARTPRCRDVRTW